MGVHCLLKKINKNMKVTKNFQKGQNVGVISPLQGYKNGVF
jgi:hypothetical protein